MGTYVLTGSASGIGACLKSMLEKAGHTLVTVDLKNADIIADLATADGRRTAIAAILARTSGAIDGFVPLAGLGGGVAQDELITRLNYFGTVELVEGLRDALAKNNGRVVLLCSHSAAMDYQDDEFIDCLLSGDEDRAVARAADVAPGSHYMIAKRALAFWMRRHAMDFARAGIRINAVAPGPINTPMTKPLFESDDYAALMQAMMDITPQQRPGEVEEVAGCIMFLLSDTASYVHGAVLFIDGGYDAHARQDHV
ncbi:MAG: SDR family oxidoreductase [Pseudomonadales bacterium]|nr:MAG: SDR family oxidoreductase [Pseudomonadales bacterium]